MADSSYQRPYDLDEVHWSSIRDTFQTYVYRTLVVERLMGGVVKWQGVSLEELLQKEVAGELIVEKLLELSPRDSPLQDLRSTGSHRFEKFRFETVEEMLEALTGGHESTVENFADLIAEEWELGVDYEGISVEPSRSYQTKQELREAREENARQFLKQWQKNVFNAVLEKS